MFHFFHVIVTTVQRVRVKTYLTAMCYNLVRARFLDRTAQAIDNQENTGKNMVKFTMFPYISGMIG